MRNEMVNLGHSRCIFRRIQARQSLFTWIVTVGEGWHNFHHTFPWDYRLAEFGQLGGISVMVLDMFSYFGLAYDLKTAPPRIVRGHMKRHGEKAAEKVNSIENLIEKSLMSLDSEAS